MYDVEHAGNGSDIRDLEPRAHTRVELRSSRDPIEHNFEPAWEALPLVVDSEGAKDAYKKGSELMGAPEGPTKRPIPRVLEVRLSDPATSAAKKEAASEPPGPSRFG